MATEANDLLDSHPTPSLLVRTDGRILYANQAAEQFFAHDEDGAGESHTPLTDLTDLGGSELAARLRQAAGASNWQPFAFQFAAGPRQGTRVMLKGRGILRNGDSEPNAFIVYDDPGRARMSAHTGLIRDLNREIARQRELREALDRSLANEKALHRELIHRVKNNLSLLSALIRNRSSETDSEEARAVLKDISFRTQSIALVHNMLDRTEEIEVVNVDELIGELCELMQGALCPPGIRITHDTANLRLHVSDATPVCLLINELVTNSIKHAFEDGAEGEIRLAFRQNGVDKLELNVRDNGRGMSLPADGGSHHGSRITQALATQLGGRLEHTYDHGTVWTLIFEPEVPAQAAE